MEGIKNIQDIKLSHTQSIETKPVKIKTSFGYHVSLFVHAMVVSNISFGPKEAMLFVMGENLFDLTKRICFYAVFKEFIY